MIADKKSKQHHYLPKSYIKNFTFSSKDEVLWAIDLVEFNKIDMRDRFFKFDSCIRKRNIKEIAVKSNDNTIFDDQGNRINGYWETFLNLPDKDFANLVNDLNTYDGSKFSIKKYPQIYTYFLALMYRNPYLRDKLLNLYEIDVEQFCNFKNTSEKENQEFIFNLQKSKRYTQSKRFILPLLLISNLTTDSELYDYYFNDVHIQQFKFKNYTFISSDNPVIAYTIHIETGLFENYIIPISPDKIIYSKIPNFNQTEDLSVKINVITIDNATRWIFSSDRSVLASTFKQYLIIKERVEFKNLNKAEFRNKLLPLN